MQSSTAMAALPAFICEETAQCRKRRRDLKEMHQKAEQNNAVFLEIPCHLTVPCAFLQLHCCERLTVKSHSCLKAQSNLLLLGPRAHSFSGFLKQLSLSETLCFQYLILYLGCVCLQRTAKAVSCPLLLLCSVCRFHRIFN